LAGPAGRPTRTRRRPHWPTRTAASRRRHYDTTSCLGGTSWIHRVRWPVALSDVKASFAMERNCAPRPIRTRCYGYVRDERGVGRVKTVYLTVYGQYTSPAGHTKSSIANICPQVTARLMAVYLAVYGLLHRVRILHRVLFGLFDQIAQAVYLTIYSLFDSLFDSIRSYLTVYGIPCAVPREVLPCFQEHPCQSE
jgi:hypothetical protein